MLSCYYSEATVLLGKKYFNKKYNWRKQGGDRNGLGRNDVKGGGRNTAGLKKYIYTRAWNQKRVFAQNTEYIMNFLAVF